VSGATASSTEFDLCNALQPKNAGDQDELQAVLDQWIWHVKWVWVGAAVCYHGSMSIDPLDPAEDHNSGNEMVLRILGLLSTTG
jgi:hypothetical protein